MSRIGMNLSGIERSLLNRLAEANAASTLSSLRMATGHKINRPGDDPSGFVFLAGLQSQLSGVTAATRNVTAASGMITQMQTALGQMQTQMTAIRSELVKDAAGTLTAAQRAASQAVIDMALDQIDALANTDINGRRTLDGSANFDISGRNANQVTGLQVYSTGGISRTISGSITSSATQAQLTHTGAVATDVTFQLTGARGAAVIQATTGEAMSSIAAKINRQSYLTGVTAAADDGAQTLTFTSVDYGTDAKVAVSVTQGAFAMSAETASGANASAVINGETISAGDNRVQGNRFRLNDNGLRYEIEFAPAQSGSFDAISVGGNALSFALGTDASRRSTLSLPGMQTTQLGGPSGILDQLRTGGSLSGLGNNTAQAIRVADEALGDLTRVQGRTSGFHNAAISSASALLSDLTTDLGKSIDAIDKTDDAEESAIQARAAILANNSIAGLSILNQQRQGIVALIKQIAGLT